MILEGSGIDVGGWKNGISVALSFRRGIRQDSNSIIVECNIVIEVGITVEGLWGEPGWGKKVKGWGCRILRKRGSSLIIL